MTPTTSFATSAVVERFVERLVLDLPGLKVDSNTQSRAEHSHDRWPEAAKWSTAEAAAHLPEVVLHPTTTAAVSAILRQATADRIAVVPFGAGSGVVGGVVNAGSFVTVDLGGLTAGPEFDDDRGEVTVGAGMIGADLERLLNARGRRIPHYPQSLALASVGGLVATRSSGTFSSKYGNIEDFLVALEVVLADGTVVSTKAVPRSSTGPSIAQLFVGSEGTLGVITSVTLRTLTTAATSRFRGIAFGTIDEGLTAVRRIFDTGVTPAVVRLYDPEEGTHLFERSGIDGGGRTLLILGFDGNESVVDAEEREALTVAGRSGGADLGAGPGNTWERTRFDASWLDRGNAGEYAFADAIEVSAAWPDLPTLHTAVLEALSPYVDNAYAHFSHFYPNGGAIYFILFTGGPDRKTAIERYRRAWDVTLKTVTDAGGSISHHHGVGEARKSWMGVEHGNGLFVLAAVKNALDPRGILAPGKLGLDATGEGANN